MSRVRASSTAAPQPQLRGIRCANASTRPCNITAFTSRPTAARGRAWRTSRARGSRSPRAPRLRRLPARSSAVRWPHKPSRETCSRGRSTLPIMTRASVQDVCAASGSACSNTSVLFGQKLNSTALEQGSGSTFIAQADYDMALAAVPSAGDTLPLRRGGRSVSLQRSGRMQLPQHDERAGWMQLPRRSRTGTARARGRWIAGLRRQRRRACIARLTASTRKAPVCSADDATHFQNLNSGIGSLAEVVSFAQDPVTPGVLLAGLGALGTAATGSATGAWPQLTTGEGGTVAIDPANPLAWYLSTGAGINIARCAKGSACTAADFATTTIGAAQTANDSAAIHAPWLLDPQLDTDLLLGTCRAWRGPASSGALWSSADILSAPFAAPASSACTSSSPVVRALGAGGPASSSANAQSAGSEVLYAGAPSRRRTSTAVRRWADTSSSRRQRRARQAPPPGPMPRAIRSPTT